MTQLDFFLMREFEKLDDEVEGWLIYDRETEKDLDNYTQQCIIK